MREFTGDWPMMRPLVLVLKLFLQQRELNEVRDVLAGEGSGEVRTKCVGLRPSWSAKFRTRVKITLHIRCCVTSFWEEFLEMCTE